MEDKSGSQNEEKRLAALAADLEKWKELEKQLSEKFENEVLQQPGEVATMLDKDYRRRRDFYNDSEIERRNGLSLVPPELREPRVTTQHDYDDVLLRAKDKADREVGQIGEQLKAKYLEAERKKFLEEQTLARELLAKEQDEKDRQTQAKLESVRRPEALRQQPFVVLKELEAVIASSKEYTEQHVLEEPQKRKEAEPDPVPDIKVDHKVMEDMYPHVDAMAELLRREHPEMYGDWDYER